MTKNQKRKMGWTEHKFLTQDCQITLHAKGIIFYQTPFSLVKFLGSYIFGYKMSIPYHSTLEIKIWGNMFKFGWNKKNKDFEQKKSWIWYIYPKSQLNSKWIYEVIVSSKIPTKNYRDFCPGSLLEGMAKISVIFGWDFGRNDDLINSFWI